MGKFFTNLVDEKLFNKWASLLDWFFDDEKFNNWTPQKIQKLTKRIKNLPQIGKKTYLYDSLKNLSFPNRRPSKNIKIILGKKDGESKDWIRHLRNGVAHGKTKIIKKPDNIWIEIKDYNKSGTQTAYIFIPINYIYQIHSFYKDINKS